MQLLSPLALASSACALVAPVAPKAPTALKGATLDDQLKKIPGVSPLKNAPADYGFDPLGFADGYGAMGTLKTAEIKHGRAAMMAITGFAVQELVWGSPVVEQTPFFFLPFGGLGR